MKTPAVHQAVMLKEVIEYLQPQKNQNFIDGTIGAGGHSEAILKLTGPNGKLLGFDWDEKAIGRCEERFKKYGDRVILINESYVQIKKVVEELNFGSISGILLDLGLSSDQLTNDGRGFSFQSDEPLDMRFSLKNDLTAAQIINEWSASQLEHIFYQYGEEQETRSIVRRIIAERKKAPILNTVKLAEIVKMSKKPNYSRKTHPATKVFQALRIAVNDELGNIEKGLNDSLDLLVSGGRLVIISFHSLEDRIVKDFIKREALGCICPPEIPVCRCNHKARLKIITRKPIVPTEEEINVNYRSRSAKLRVAEKI